MPATVIRFDGATFPSRPRADAGMMHGKAIVLPAPARNDLLEIFMLFFLFEKTSVEYLL
jgi:hypothetical protein